jgi:predicted Zn-dependent protease
MKTITIKKATAPARLRRVAVRPNSRRKVKMPDFMKNLKAAYGNYSFDHLLAKVDNGL